MGSGVLKQLGIAERSYYTADDIEAMLGVSKSKAYNMIRDMRKELIADGKLASQYPAGKIPKRHFDTLCMIK